jgi:hypothetical protein
MTLSVTLAYATLLVLAALALLHSHWPAWLKGLLVLGVTVLYFHGAAVISAIWGLPSADGLPPRFVLLAAVIEEPAQGTPGALYVWVNALEDGKPAREPRAYRLAYTKDLHALLNEGMKKTRQGVSQVGSAEPRAGRQGLAWLRPGRDELDVKIRDLPVPQLPEK